MATRVSPNVQCWQLRTPSSLPLRHVTERNNITMPCRLVHERNSFFSTSSKNLRLQRVKRVCSSHFDDFHTEEMMNMVHDDENGNKQIAQFNGKFQKEKFLTVKPDEILEPSLLSIQPEPPSWPERDEILRLSFERRLKSVGIPLSIRMIKKKLKLQEGVKEVSEIEFTHCSVKKTFSSMLFIHQQLQNHALQTRESLCCENLQGVMVKLQREMDASFVWLFQQVFCENPTLMVNLMVLLTNFSVNSVNNNTVAMDVTAMSMITKVISLSKQKHPQLEVEVDQDECVKEELTEEEEMVWNSMLEEASLLKQKEWGSGEVLDHETMSLSLAPVSVQLEGDQYEEYVQTEVYYQKLILLTPHSSLLLSNYAQFLFLVLHDIDGAEEYYKRSVLVESPDAEAYSRYADFLLLIRKDAWAAELRYLQALEVDPGNTFYLSKYASFLWNHGGQDSSSSGLPVEELDNLQL